MVVRITQLNYLNIINIIIILMYINLKFKFFKFRIQLINNL